MKTRREFRQRFLEAMGLGFTGVTTSAGTTTTLVDSRFTKYPDDYFNRAEVLITSGADDDGTVRYVTDFAGSTGTFTITPALAAPAAGVSFELVKDEATFGVWNSLLRQAHQYLADRTLIPAIDESIVPLSGNYLYAIPHEHTRANLVADAGGSTTTLVDSALAEGDDYWNGALVIGLSGTIAGTFATVSDYHPVSGATPATIGVVEPWSAAPDGSTYTLWKPKLYSIHRIYYAESTDRFVRLSPATWTIDRSGGISFIRFHHSQSSEMGFSDIISMADAVPLKRLRIEGYRRPRDPVLDSDPIEIPEAVIAAWMRALWHENFGWRDKGDPAAHLQMLVAARNFAEAILQQEAVVLPPGSVRV